MKPRPWVLIVPTISLAISGSAVDAQSPTVHQTEAFRVGLTGTEVVASLPVAPEHIGGYVRSEFGDSWYDLDRNGCDTREDVLRNESTVPAVIGSGCTIVSGRWYSPYDDAVWTNKSDVDIDHMVPLKEVWDSGGWAWTAAQRLAYANDLTDDRTLIAVTDNVNQSKGDRDPAEWMPPRTAYWCTYASEWVAIKARWGLSIDSTEANFLRALFAGRCAGVVVDSWNSAPAGVSSIVPSTPTTAPTTAVTTSPVRASPTTTVKTSVNSRPGTKCTKRGQRATYRGRIVVCRKVAGSRVLRWK